MDRLSKKGNLKNHEHDQSNEENLGRSSLQVSALGLGCWAIGGPWRWLDGQGGWGDIDDNRYRARQYHAAARSRD